MRTQTKKQNWEIEKAQKTARRKLRYKQKPLMLNENPNCNRIYIYIFIWGKTHKKDSRTKNPQIVHAILLKRRMATHFITNFGTTYTTEFTKESANEIAWESNIILKNVRGFSRQPTNAYQRFLQAFTNYVAGDLTCIHRNKYENKHKLKNTILKQICKHNHV